jgi:hypothetical protein
MAKSKYTDDECPTCGMINGHDCDCCHSSFPKCARCHGAYNMRHVVTGEELSCLCGEEAK